MIVVMGAGVAMGTGAFFSDTETSTGNTFTAGAIDLKVDSEQHYNGNVCVNGLWAGSAPYPVEGTACDGTWLPTDLGVQKFFNFGDLKPGDEGENTLSFHVTSNDAWLKAGVGDISDLDGSCTEPEEESADTCTMLLPDVDPGDGELAESMMFRAWVDDGVTDGWDGSSDLEEGDNIYQSNEVLVAGGDANGWMTLSALDSALAATPAWGMTPINPFYLGMEWKLDGATTGNAVQTDSLGFPLMFEVQQMRNNSTPSFGI